MQYAVVITVVRSQNRCLRYVQIEFPDVHPAPCGRASPLSLSMGSGTGRYLWDSITIYLCRVASASSNASFSLPAIATMRHSAADGGCPNVSEAIRQRIFDRLSEVGPMGVLCRSDTAPDSS